MLCQSQGEDLAQMREKQRGFLRNLAELHQVNHHLQLSDATFYDRSMARTNRERQIFMMSLSSVPSDSLTMKMTRVVSLPIRDRRLELVKPTAALPSGLHSAAKFTIKYIAS